MLHMLAEISMMSEKFMRRKCDGKGASDVSQK
jgi:hypothetical protein